MSRVVHPVDELEPCPHVAFRPGPWSEPLGDVTVDRERTEALRAWDHHVVTRAGGGPPWHGIPFQVVGPQDRRRRVWLSREPGSWLPWAWDPFPSANVRLPDVVRRYGDPSVSAWGDYQSFLVDGDRYIELSGFGPTVLGWPHPWRTGGYSAFHLNLPWTHPRQPRGVSAAGLPMVPLLLTKEKLTGVQPPTAMHLVSPHYSGDGWEGWANKTDGETPGHPLRAGTRLRLRPDFLTPPGVSHDDREFLHLARTFGFVLTDKNSHQGAAARPVPFDQTVPGFRVRCAQDPRIDISVRFHASDLEVLKV